jgi:hypothetical protein
MNCQQLFSALGFGCQPLETHGQQPVFHIRTPFRFSDGNAISVFVEDDDEFIKFFDAGETLFQLLGSGLSFRDGRALKPLRRVVEDIGATVTDAGDIELFTPASHIEEAFSTYLRALIAVSSWEQEHIGMPPDANTLAVEAENYLMMWKPSAHMMRRQGLPGISGREHEFAFLLDNEYIDVIPSRPQSTGSELRKLVDVRKSGSNAGVSIRVIVDDRHAPERAREEVSIIGGLATAWTMTDLINAAAKSRTTPAAN